jgi:hypothetical protein
MEVSTGVYTQPCALSEYPDSLVPPSDPPQSGQSFPETVANGLLLVIFVYTPIIG